MIGRSTILKWIKDELKETVKSLDLKLGKPENNALFSVYSKSKGILSAIPMDFWSGDEMMVLCPHIKFTNINKALFELTGIEEFGINAFNYKCANVTSLGKTDITSRAKLDLYLWPLKNNIRNYFIEVDSILNPTALVDKWYELNEMSEIDKYFPMGFKYLFIYFIAKINIDDRSSQILEEAKAFYADSIAGGLDFYEEHLESLQDLAVKMEEFGDEYFDDLLVNTFENCKTIRDIDNFKKEEKSIIHKFYLTDLYIVKDNIGSNIVEFKKYGLLALSNSNIAFYDIGDSIEELKRKAQLEIQEFSNNKFDKTVSSFCLGTYTENEDYLIFKQYAFNMHPRYFNKKVNGEIENDGLIYRANRSQIV